MKTRAWLSPKTESKEPSQCAEVGQISRYIKQWERIIATEA